MRAPLLNAIHSGTPNATIPGSARKAKRARANTAPSARWRHLFERRAALNRGQPLRPPYAEDLQRRRESRTICEQAGLHDTNPAGARPRRGGLHGRTAIPTKRTLDVRTAVATTDVAGRLAFDAHVRRAREQDHGKLRAARLLAVDAVTERDGHGLASQSDAYLPAQAGPFVCGNGAHPIPPL
jgi:hypothetical protein